MEARRATFTAGLSSPILITICLERLATDRRLRIFISGEFDNAQRAFDTSNIISDAPLLGELLDNGGPTPTHALLIGSPAIDHGSDALAVVPLSNPIALLETDRARHGLSEKIRLPQ